MFSTIINILHFLGIFVPVLIYFFPVKYIKPIFKYVLLIYILIPMMWQFTNNECILTEFVIDNGHLNNTISESEFSEKYLSWLYKPLIKLAERKWTNTNINNIVHTHYILNLILLWAYLFFIGGKNVI